MQILKSLPVIPLVFFFPVSKVQAEGQKPNVVFIITDDQGYGDLGCHGNPLISTPNLDRLHSESVRFTNFHVGTTCAPSRAGLLSGQYCNKVGAWHTINGREMLAAGEATLPETLKSAGYKTAIFGKWHLGDNYPFRPQDRGFDEVLIHGGGGVGQQPDYWNNDYFDDTYFRNGEPERFEGYCTDIWFSEAMKFIDNNAHRPFFCYISTNAPHGPFHVAENYSRMYEDVQGVPNPQFYGMITNIDENVGRLRDKLESAGIAENTIIVFMTDNGTAAGVKFGKDGEVISGYNAGMRGIKGSPYDGGHRVPFFIHWPAGGLNSGIDVQKLTSYIDFMPSMLDLCGIDPSIPGIQGRSLKPLVSGRSDKWPDRILFTDTQREEYLVKYRQFAVMTDRWRLVNKEELYDIAADPGQRTNLAAEFPAVVEEMMAAYEFWWEDVSRNADRYHRIVIGSDRENPLRLNSHDIHSEKGYPAWSQDMVRAGTGVNGFWALEIAETGRYEFELCRWPKESGLSMTQTAPPGQEVPGGRPFSEGKALDIRKARLKIGDVVKTNKVKPESSSVRFRFKLKKGEAFLQTWLCDESSNNEWPACYVYVKKL